MFIRRAERDDSLDQFRNEVREFCLATADAAKFPDAVEAATGLRPALPAALADLLARPERFVVVPATLEAIEAAVRAHAR